MPKPYTSPHSTCQGALSIALVANGAIDDYVFMAELIKTYDRCVAVDGGLIHCHNMKISPDLIMGDRDSTPAELTALYSNIPTLYFPTDKDHTDLELAIQAANWPGVQKIGLFGVLGKRADHSIVNLHLLRRFPKKMVIETENETILSVCGHHHQNSFPGQMVSLIPIGEGPSGITTKGLKWELNNAKMDGNFFSISNVCLDDHFEIAIANGDLLLCLLRKP